jgi:hypothetical protein
VRVKKRLRNKRFLKLLTKKVVLHLYKAIIIVMILTLEIYSLFENKFLESKDDLNLLMIYRLKNTSLKAILLLLRVSSLNLIRIWSRMVKLILKIFRLQDVH